MTDKEFINDMATYKIDHEPDGWPAVQQWKIDKILGMIADGRQKVERLEESLHYVNLQPCPHCTELESELEQVRGERDKWYIQGNEFKEAWLNNMKRADLSEAELKDYTIYAEGQYAEIFGECRGWQVRAEKVEAENTQLKEDVQVLTDCLNGSIKDPTNDIK